MTCEEIIEWEEAYAEAARRDFERHIYALYEADHQPTPVQDKKEI